ncbi:hypothetical protein KCU90_g185, partial [Aureobasidium melanogenum]
MSVNRITSHSTKDKTHLNKVCRIYQGTETADQVLQSLLDARANLRSFPDRSLEDTLHALSVLGQERSSLSDDMLIPRSSANNTRVLRHCQRPGQCLDLLQRVAISRSLKKSHELLTLSFTLLLKLASNTTNAVHKYRGEVELGHCPCQILRFDHLEQLQARLQHHQGRDSTTTCAGHDIFTDCVHQSFTAVLNDLGEVSRTLIRVYVSFASGMVTGESSTIVLSSFGNTICRACNASAVLGAAWKSPNASIIDMSFTHTLSAARSWQHRSLRRIVVVSSGRAVCHSCVGQLRAEGAAPWQAQDRKQFQILGNEMSTSMKSNSSKIDAFCTCSPDDRTVKPSNDDKTFCRCVGVLRWMVALMSKEASSKNMGQHKICYPTGFRH